MNKKRVLLGMSGGVDSSVSALLLKNEGYEVIGATMKLWQDDNYVEIEGGCCSESSAYDAKRVCDLLDIPHYVLDFTKEFKCHVIDDFINCYKEAKTPNPCIECNRHLKFNVFYKKALELDCNYIATGHYAKTEFSKEYNSYVLKKSKAKRKDQSYVLYNIPKEIIKNTLFPLGDFEEKEQIREIAKKNGLKVASKPDSQEICFIPDNDYVSFLINNMDKKPKPGNIRHINGEILGKHKGLINYTIGQRKGLGISSKEPLYVIKLDKEKNELIVGSDKDIYSTQLYVTDVNLLIDMDLSKKIKVMAKIRYSAKEAPAIIYNDEKGKLRVEFENPQRAITPGQSIVFYRDDIVLGGGKIEDTI